MTTLNTLYLLCVLATLTSIAIAIQIALGPERGAGFPEPLLFGILIANAVFIFTCLRLARGVKKPGQK